MGPLAQMLEMLPGNLGQAARSIDPKDAEDQLKLTEAIINSMTPGERRNPDVLNASRRRRIARGSGTEVQDVNRLIKQFREAQKMFKIIAKNRRAWIAPFVRLAWWPGEVSRPFRVPSPSRCRQAGSLLKTYQFGSSLFQGERFQWFEFVYAVLV